ncbi:hypothetical protein BD410DRAFT_8519 [Rickenella mellea]|uniref:Nudix hydrolase domain-containing protein n=1 Tax=Rickenella mellea TaxID=50990 RepID=A0A4R5XF64_9AGAM|nr:hypothetical protein BD410DRAFT_8519 [Rickenella mellea]
MSKPKIPTTQLYSHEFVNCAGSVLFRRPTEGNVQVCFLRHLTKDEWLLPKGRQDRGEALAAAAVRETFEETGYPCSLLPVGMMTRATLPGVDSKDHPAFAKGCTEPFTVSLRHVSDRNIKLIWWFITIVPELDGERRPNSQMPSENFEAVFCDVNLDMDDESDTVMDSTVSKLTFANDREIVKVAIKLVAKTYPQWFSVPNSI